MTVTDQKPNRGGAPKGNQNRMTHALKASKLPKDAKAEEHAGYAFRRLFMEALEVTHGKGRVPAGLQALVQTAHRREMEARLAARWLRREEKLTLAERLNLASTISTASEARDRILTRLGLVPGAEPKAPGRSLLDLFGSVDEIEAETPDVAADASSALCASEQGSEKPDGDVTPLGPSFPQPGESLPAEGDL